MIAEFLEAVLGRPGAAALGPLQKSVFAPWIPARAALAWVGETSESGPFLPGTSIPMVLAKTEYGWSGVVGDYGFVDASASHVVAAMTVHLGFVPGRPDIKSQDLARLGRTIDALVKAEKTKGGGGGDEGGKGAADAAIPHTDATPPTAVAPPMKGPKKPRVKLPAVPKTPSSKPVGIPKVPKPTGLPKVTVIPKAPKTTEMKLSEAATGVRCEACGSRQFDSGRFKGCLCFRSLAKSVVSEPIRGGVKLTLTGWDEDAITTLREALKL